MARRMTEDFIGTCQWCFGEYKVNPRRQVVLHGYQRPGYGHTVGNCQGYNHAPFDDAHDLTDKRIVLLKEEIDKLNSQIKMIDSGKVKKLKNPHFLAANDPRRSDRWFRASEQSDTEYYTPEHREFPRYLRTLRANLESEAKYIGDIVTYLEEQVANWTKKPIVGLDSPATGRERYIRDAYDPIKAKEAADFAERKAVRDAKPGKITINLWRKLPFPQRNAGLSDEQWRAGIEEHYANEKAMKEEIKAWAKATFPGKVWVGDGDKGEIWHAAGIRDYGDGYSVECIAVKPEWQYLDKVMEMFPQHHRLDKDANSRDKVTKQGMGKGKDIRIWVSADTLPS